MRPSSKDSTPDEVREFTKGRFELLHIGGMTIGRATYEAGWKWVHARASADQRREGQLGTGADFPACSVGGATTTSRFDQNQQAK
jgi:hypothetical protein